MRIGSSYRLEFAIPLTAISAVIWVALGFFLPFLELTTNAYLYIYSSQAQVVAAVYGLTITGYVFVRNQQDRLQVQDESLAEILAWIQFEQHTFISFITTLAIVAILLSLIAIGALESDLHRLGIASANLASALSAASMLWIATFVLDATRPDQIRKASETLKEQVDAPSQESHQLPGAFEQFLQEFNTIERMLEAFERQHLEKEDRVFPITGSPFSQSRRYASRLSRRQVVRALATQGIITEGLEKELYAITKYRNALVHGADMKVSEAMLDRARQARRLLEQQLHDLVGLEPKPSAE